MSPWPSSFRHVPARGDEGALHGSLPARDLRRGAASRRCRPCCGARVRRAVELPGLSCTSRTLPGGVRPRRATTATPFSPRMAGGACRGMQSARVGPARHGGRRFERPGRSPLGDRAAVAKRSFARMRVHQATSGGGCGSAPGRGFAGSPVSRQKEARRKRGGPCVLRTWEPVRTCSSPRAGRCGPIRWFPAGGPWSARRCGTWSW